MAAGCEHERDLWHDQSGQVAVHRAGSDRFFNISQVIILSSSILVKFRTMRRRGLKQLGVRLSLLCGWSVVVTTLVCEFAGGLVV